MNYMSVCSGVEAASLAWDWLGWKPVAFSEIEPFPCAVLEERFPGVPNLGDMTKIEVTDDEIHGAGFTVCRRDVDLLVGGTPCQSFSVAGLREGLKGASGLAFHFVRLLREIQPKWFVWENVPGALSSRTDGQLDFNFLVGEFAECGYGLAWRILDAQYVRSKSFPFAIPQRRRRLFVVGCLGDGESAGKVLFDGESLSGDTPPRRIKTQGSSGCAETSLGMSVRTAHTKANGCGIGVGVAHTLGASDVDAVWWDGSDKAGTLTARLGTGGGNTPLVQDVVDEDNTECYPINGMMMGRKNNVGDRQAMGIGKLNDPLPTIYASHHHAVSIIRKDVECQEHLTVRRIMPVEVERLMGFPDGWTQIPWRGKPAEQCPDGPRYKACGNSFCVNCMEWIGERIEKVERELQEEGR